MPPNVGLGPSSSASNIKRGIKASAGSRVSF
jgi:hypothetical protein